MYSTCTPCTVHVHHVHVQWNLSYRTLWNKNTLINKTLLLSLSPKHIDPRNEGAPLIRTLYCPTGVLITHTSLYSHVHMYTWWRRLRSSLDFLWKTSSYKDGTKDLWWKFQVLELWAEIPPPLEDGEMERENKGREGKGGQGRERRQLRKHRGRQGAVSKMLASVATYSVVSQM